MCLRRARWIAPLAFVVMLVMSPVHARAQMRIGGVRTEFIPDPNYRHFFEVYLEAGSYVQGSLVDGDFITIYDLPGLIIGTNRQPDNWAAIFYGNLGLDPPGPPPFIDDPTIPNVTFRFIAPGGERIEVPPGDSRVLVGEFSIQTLQDLPQTQFNYGTRTHLPGGGTQGTYGTVFSVPEPTTLALMAMGLGAVGLYCRHRARVVRGTG